MDEQARFDIARAERAKLIIEDPLVVSALADMKAHLVAAWEQSPARDAEGREHLFRFMKVMGQFESAFRCHIETGKLVTAEMQAEEERKTLMDRIKEKVRG